MFGAGDAHTSPLVPSETREESRRDCVVDPGSGPSPAVGVEGKPAKETASGSLGPNDIVVEVVFGPGYGLSSVASGEGNEMSLPNSPGVWSRSGVMSSGNDAQMRNLSRSDQTPKSVTSRCRLQQTYWKFSVFFFLILAFLPCITAGNKSPFKQKIAHLGTYYNEEYGVAISPAGLVLTASHVEHVPVLIQLTLPNWHYSDTEYTVCGTEQLTYCSDCCVNSTCLTPDTLLETIANLKLELTDTYKGILDSPYFTTLLHSFCDSNSEFCDQHKNREKRFLGLIAAGLLGLSGTGLGVINSIHLNKLDSKFNAMTYCHVRPQRS